MRFLHQVLGEMISLVLCAWILWGNIGVVQAQIDWKKEWERTLQEAKKEGTVVAGIPARVVGRPSVEAPALEMDQRFPHKNVGEGI